VENAAADDDAADRRHNLGRVRRLARRARADARAAARPVPESKRSSWQWSS
jgi:hypothetical protein